MTGIITIQPQDYELLATAVGLLLVVIACGWLSQKWFGIHWKTVLTRREWQLALKLAGIVLLTLLLILAQNALRLPQEMFIYGRF